MIFVYLFTGVNLPKNPGSVYRKVTGRHFYQYLIEENIKKKETQKWKYFMSQRKVLIEGSFGNAKVNHGLNKAKMRGIKKVKEQSLMTAIAQNIKKYIKELKRKTSFYSKKAIFWVKYRLEVSKKKLGFEFFR